VQYIELSSAQMIALLVPFAESEGVGPRTTANSPQQKCAHENVPEPAVRALCRHARNLRDCLDLGCKRSRQANFVGRNAVDAKRINLMKPPEIL
jgi:hypothetical protein